MKQQDIISDVLEKIAFEAGFTGDTSNMGLTHNQLAGFVYQADEGDVWLGCGDQPYVVQGTKLVQCDEIEPELGQSMKDFIAMAKQLPISGSSEIRQSLTDEMAMMNEDERYEHIIAEFGE